MRFFLFFSLGVSLFATDFFYEFGKKVVVTPVKNSRSISGIDSITYYKTKSGIKIRFKNEIVTKVKDGVNASDFFKDFQITNFSKISKNTYLIKLSANQNLFQLSQRLYESGKTIYAIPNKIQKYKKR